MRKIAARRSTKADWSAVYEFYTENPHPYLAFRPDSCQQACAEGNIFIISIDGYDALMGAVFFHSDKFAEFAQARCRAPSSGLLKLLHALRFFWARKKVGADGLIIGITAEPNTVGSKALLSLGFEVFEPSSELRGIVEETLPQDRKAENLDFGVLWHKPTSETEGLCRERIIKHQHELDLKADTLRWLGLTSFSL